MGTSLSAAEFLRAIDRVRACYVDDPGLAAPVAQLSALTGVSTEICATACDVLVKDGYLTRCAAGRFARADTIRIAAPLSPVPVRSPCD